jgi:glycosyltransferase involved in cell wall biosynthesis
MSATDGTPAEVKVSVAMITYNHERFIAQAIESVLMQETDFPVELVIGEDCSTDSTRAIVQEYAARYPDKIKALLHPHNLGPAYSPGKNNLVSVLKACTGKYVALLEGDDYWTDPRKLQKQVEFLDTHPSCALCFHKVLVVQDDKSSEPYVFEPKCLKETYTLKDYLGSDLLQTGSIMFRSSLVGDYPVWFYEVPIGDWGLVTLLAEHGDLGYIDELMGVYRMYAGGLWSATRRAVQLQWKIHTLATINVHLRFRYDDTIRARMSRYYRELRQIPGVEETAEVAKHAEVDRPAKILQRWEAADPLPKPFKDQLLGQEYGHLFFYYYGIRAFAQVRRCLAYMIRYDASWLRNRDVWAISAEAFLGLGLTDRLRSAARTARMIKHVLGMP